MSKRDGGGIIRVLLTAASAVRRAGLEALLRKTPALKLVGSLESTRNLDRYIHDLTPDVILVDSDVTLPDLRHDSPLVVLIDEPNASWIAEALRSGVKAILSRDASIEAILAAIQAAHSGLVLLDPSVTSALAARIGPSPSFEDGLSESLTPREIEVLGMLAEGLGNRDIAGRLGISDHTVKFHISSILDKLGAASRTEAVTIGLRKGLILL